MPTRRVVRSRQARESADRLAEIIRRQRREGAFLDRSPGAAIGGTIGAGADLAGGLGELGLTMGSATVAEPVAGLMGMMTGGAGLDASADTVRAVREGLTYAPRGEAGQGMVQGIGQLFEPLMQAQGAMGEFGAEYAGPAGGAAMETAIPAMMTAIPFLPKGLRSFRSKVTPGAAGSAPGRANSQIQNQRGSVKVLDDNPAAALSVPGVAQYGLERYAPKKQPASIARLYDQPNVDRIKGLIDQGGDVGQAWYNTDALRQYLGNELGDAGPEVYKQFMDRVAATSPRSTVADNIKRASYFDMLSRQGNPFDMGGDQPPKGLGHLAHKTHAGMLQNIENAGPQGQPWDLIKQPKAGSFSQNLQGNFQPLTADAHFVRGIGLTKEGGDLQTGAPSKTQYGGVEQFGSDIAEQMGIAPAQMQSGLWVGGAAETGVRNPQTFMQSLNDSILKAAARQGISPQEALKRFAQAQGYLGNASVNPYANPALMAGAAKLGAAGGTRSIWDNE